MPDTVKIVKHRTKNSNINGERVYTGFVTTSEANLKTAIKWATGYSTPEKEAEPEIVEVENRGFKLSILNGPGHSYNGGKLSFCMCLISKGKLKTAVGISTDSLVELIKSTTFKNGTCIKTVSFYRESNQLCVMIDSEADKLKQQLKDNDKSKLPLTSKWIPGVMYTSPSGLNTQCYIGDIYKCFDIDYSDYAVRYSGDTKLRVLLSDSYLERVMRELELDRYPKLSELRDFYIKHVNEADKCPEHTEYTKAIRASGISLNPLRQYKSLVKTLPKRVKTDKKIEMDISAEEYLRVLVDTMQQTFSKYIKAAKKEYTANPHGYSYLVNMLNIGFICDTMFKLDGGAIKSVMFNKDEMAFIKSMADAIEIYNSRELESYSHRVLYTVVNEIINTKK